MSYPRPKTLLTMNSELRQDGIWTWDLPAFNTKLPSGEMFNVCPQAGACAQMCYARNGTYNFPATREAHLRKLMYLLEDPEGWEDAMAAEIKRKKRIPYLRIHSSGDLYSGEYLLRWVHLAKNFPGTTMYFYSKSVSLVKQFSYLFPPNLLYLFSLGGREDHLIDKDVDRHAEVFPSMEALLAAGYMDQGGSDLLAVTLPTNKIGIVQNNIPAFKKRLGTGTFGSLQMAQDIRRGIPR